MRIIFFMNVYKCAGKHVILYVPTIHKYYKSIKCLYFPLITFSKTIISYSCGAFHLLRVLYAALCVYELFSTRVLKNVIKRARNVIVRIKL